MAACLLSLAARRELHKRIEHVILTDPMSSDILAQRFGVSAELIRRLARKLGVKLPRGEYLSTRSTQRFNQKWSRAWGPSGHHG